MDIKFEYVVGIPGNTFLNDVNWEHKSMIVHIDGKGKFLTYSEILWQLHKETHNFLKDQDNHYFEGLAFLQVSNEGIPVYVLYLGS